MVIKSDVISRTKRTINSVEDITTQELYDESKEPSPNYYIAAVVNASQYEDADVYRMGYDLGTKDSTTGADNHPFRNKELEKKYDLEYFFRVYSVSSTHEVWKLIVYVLCCKIHIHT